MNTMPPRRKLARKNSFWQVKETYIGSAVAKGCAWGGLASCDGRDTVQDCPESRVMYALAPNQHFIQNCYGKATANCFCKRSEGRGFAHCHNGVCSLSCASAVKHTSMLIAETGPGAFNTSKLVLSPVKMKPQLNRGCRTAPEPSPRARDMPPFAALSMGGSSLLPSGGMGTTKLLWGLKFSFLTSIAFIYII